MKTKLGFKGNVKIRTLKDNKLIYEKHNLITLNGIQFILNKINNTNTTDQPQFLSISNIDQSPIAQSKTEITNEIIRIQASSISTTTNSIEYRFVLSSVQAVDTWRVLGLYTLQTSGILTNVIASDFSHPSQDISVTWTISLEDNIV